jgi:hypothetical protein
MSSMRNRSMWMRAAVLLLTLLQFNVAAAAALADARAGAEQAGPAHIESHSTSGCARVHPADCAFHRFLNAPLARTPSAVLRVSEGRGITWVQAAAERAAIATDLTLPDSRAPPPLS